MERIFRQHRPSAMFVACCLLAALSVSRAAEPLFSDSFEKISGTTKGSVTPVAGKVGKAIQLQGASQVTYPAKGHVDPNGGEASFWVKLNFDPTEKNDKTRTVLRNQIFLTFRGAGYGGVMVYATLTQVCLAVKNEQNTLLFVNSYPLTWKPDEWHLLSVTWGKEMAMWEDGQRKTSSPWNGLFGPMPATLENIDILIGSNLGVSDVENEFTMDELVIKGPTAGQVNARPRLLVPFLPDDPPLDGTLTNAFWKKAARVSGLVKFDRNELAPRQPVLYVACTAKGFYCGLDAPLGEGALPHAVLSEHDGFGITQEDGLEIYLQPAADNPTYYQFITSAIGTRCELRVSSGKFDAKNYNPEWTVKTGSQPGKWLAEVFIPFNDATMLKAPQPGELWKANFCVDSAGGFAHAATWSFISGNFHQPNCFGELLFAGKDRALREETFAGFPTGEPTILMSLEGDFRPIITVSARIVDAADNCVYQNEMPLRDAKSFEIKPPFLTSGHYSVQVTGVEPDNRLLFAQAFGFRTEKPFNLTLENYPYAGYVRLQANANGLKTAPAKVVCTVSGPNPTPLDPVEITAFRKGISEGRIPCVNLAPGTYTVDARVLAAGDQVIESARQNFQVFAKPSWWRNTLGINHSVPPPFQPVKRSPQQVSAWGREYQLGKSVFPQQIWNQTAATFSRRPEFRIKVDGQSSDLYAVGSKKEEVFPDQVTIVGEQALPNLTASCVATFEFDGFMRFDITLTPRQAATLHELILSLPIKPEIARFLLASTGVASNTLTLDKPFSSPFLPYLWIGNDEMGLAWFAESDQFWDPRDTSALQVTPGEKEVALNVNFVRNAIPLEKPITLTFGLMASPVKPTPVNDPFHHRYAYQERHTTMAAFAEHLVYPSRGNVTAATGTIEFFVKRSEGQADAVADLLTIGSGKNQVLFQLSPAANGSALVMRTANEKLFSMNTPVGTASFSHLAVGWGNEGIVCHADGKRVGSVSGKAFEAFRMALADTNGLLRFGCAKNADCATALILDEIRNSGTVRYGTESFVIPAAPFTRDEATLLLDHLDESFRPDGQDAETAAGGVPSIGCRFVPAHFGPGLKIATAPPRPAMELLRELGINLVYDNWLQDATVKYGWPPTLLSETRPEIKDELSANHRYGMKTVPYIAFPGLSSLSSSGLVEKYGDEWCIKPVGTMPFTGGYWLNVCMGAKGYADYLTAGAAWVMDELGYDGFYSDGQCLVYACQNQAHGCGYLDAQGILHSTYPIFAVREGMKRMYRVVKERNADGIVINHNSFNLLLPTESFSDIVYTGEHEDYENLLTGRIRFSSRPSGLYTATLGSSDHAYSPLHTMASLLNGASVLTMGILGRNDMARKQAAIQAVYDRFDTKTAVWVPWFQAEKTRFVNTAEEMKTSLYYHPGRTILLIAGNFGKEVREASLALDLQKFGLVGKELIATNALTGQDVPLSAKGELTVKIKPKSFSLVLVAATATPPSR